MKVPRGQFVQLVLPVVPENLPVTQVLQLRARWLSSGWNRPVGHFSQALLCEKLPALQVAGKGVHVLKPVPFATLSAGQAVHSEAPAAATLPKLQV